MVARCKFGQTVSMPSQAARSRSTTAARWPSMPAELGNGRTARSRTDPASIAGLIAGTGGQGTANQVTWNSGSTLADRYDQRAGAVDDVHRRVSAASAPTGGGTTNAVGFTKRGAGTLTLAGNNTFSGPLSIAGSSGTLLLTGTNSNAGTTMTIPTVGIGTNSTLQLGISNSLPSGTLINTQGPSAQMFLQPALYADHTELFRATTAS